MAAQVAIPDVLAERYASPAMREVWSAEGRVVLERDLWIAVLRVQQSRGLPVAEGVLEAYQQVQKDVQLDSIAARERTLRHDVKARIEEFCALAGHEAIHQGLTSRDLTDNVEQLQVRRSLGLLAEKTAAALLRLADRAEAWADQPLAARTHNVPAQLATLGKRLAMFGEELLLGLEALESLLERYPLRGLKGAVGTRLDQALLLGGLEAAQAAEEQLVEALAAASAHGLERDAAAGASLRRPPLLEAVGQVYPRSLDFACLSALHQLCAPLAGFANTLRLMAGAGLASEGFQPGQVGSSSMPHKTNARSCERICGLHVVLGGFVDMAARLAGSQWNEGDVSCSVVRRVALPGGMFAADGALETFLTILDEMHFFIPAVDAEVQRELPFLASSALLMAALAKDKDEGAAGGREALHSTILQHAQSAIAELREGASSSNSLPRRLGADPRFPLDEAEIRTVLERNIASLLGAAPAQAKGFAARARKAAARYPAAATLQPEAIL